MKPITLTPFERKALAILRDNGAYRNLSAIGYVLFEGEKENRKRNPSPQGMALAASRFIRPLTDKNLIRWDWDDGYTILNAGRELLAKLEADERQQAEVKE